MPILEAYSHAWLASEVLDVRPGGNVLVANKNPLDLFIENPRDPLAIKAETLREASLNPNKFKPSIRVLPGGSVPIPADCILVDQNTKLCVGANVEVEAGRGWADENRS